MRNKSTGTLRR